MKLLQINSAHKPRASFWVNRPCYRGSICMCFGSLDATCGYLADSFWPKEFGQLEVSKPFFEAEIILNARHHTKRNERASHVLTSTFQHKWSMQWIEIVSFSWIMQNVISFRNSFPVEYRTFAPSAAEKKEKDISVVCITHSSSLVELKLFKNENAQTENRLEH